MNREDVIRMARDSGLVGLEQGGILENFQRFAALVAAEKDKEIERLQDMLYELLGELTALRAEKQMRGYIKQLKDSAATSEREKVAAWMRSKSYATGHGDTIEDLLKELEWQVAEREREACAKVCDGWMHANGNDCAEAIRARGET